jgi:3-oxocholest-4-en-26-oate---CoA ligase
MEMHFATLWEAIADTIPEHTATVHGATRRTWAEYDDRAARLASAFTAAGLGPDSKIGMYLYNCNEYLETQYAGFKMRAVPVNVNYRYLDDELWYLLDNADAEALVFHASLADRVERVRGRLPKLKLLVEVDDLGTHHYASNRGSSARFEEVIAAHDPMPRITRDESDIYMLYTGGTTGYPKGVLWRHEDVWRTLGGGIDFATGEAMPDEWEQSKRAAAAPAGLVRLCAAPLIHGNAQWGALAALFAGDTVVFVPQFDPHDIWRAVQRHRVNVLIIIGDAMARPLIEAYREEQYDLSSVLAISSSAALFSPVVKDEYLKLLPGIVVTDAIGASETGFTGLGYVSAANNRAEGPTVTPGPSTIVIDDDNKPVGPGQIGRLARGGHIPLGYYKDPVKTAALFADVDGVRYAVPGDLARVEADGSLTLLGRGNTCVNTGGEKVYPEEVEGALKSHDDVFDALVIGVPDHVLGQRVAAMVQPRTGRTIDVAALDAHLRTQIAGYKVPRSVWQVAQIARTPAGKADYGWARRYAEEHAETANRTSA